MTFGRSLFLTFTDLFKSLGGRVFNISNPVKLNGIICHSIWIEPIELQIKMQKPNFSSQNKNN